MRASEAGRRDARVHAKAGVDAVVADTPFLLSEQKRPRIPLSDHERVAALDPAVRGEDEES
jgi:hypothetical protein